MTTSTTPSPSSSNIEASRTPRMNKPGKSKNNTKSTENSSKHHSKLIDERSSQREPLSMTKNRQSPPPQQPPAAHELKNSQLTQFQSFLTSNININNSTHQHHPHLTPHATQHPHFHLQPHQQQQLQQQQPINPLLNLQNQKQWQDYMFMMANALKHQQQQQTAHVVFNNNLPGINHLPMNPALYQSVFATFLKQVSSINPMRGILAANLDHSMANKSTPEQDLSSSSSTCSSSYDVNNNKQSYSSLSIIRTETEFDENLAVNEVDDDEDEIEIEEGEIDPNFEEYDGLEIAKVASKMKQKGCEKITATVLANSGYSSQSLSLYSSSSSSSTPPSSVSSNSSLSNNKIKLETNLDVMVSGEAINNNEVKEQKSLKHSIDFILGRDQSNRHVKRKQRSFGVGLTKKGKQLVE